MICVSVYLFVYLCVYVCGCPRLSHQSQVVVIRQKSNRLGTGAVVGIAIGTFFVGAILCAVVGFFAAIQYLIYKRKQHKKLADQKM